MRSILFNPAVGARLLLNGIPFTVEKNNDAAELTLKRTNTQQRITYTVAEMARLALEGTCQLADAGAKPPRELPATSLNELQPDKRNAVLRKLAYVKAALAEYPVGPKSHRLAQVIADLASRRSDGSPPSAHSVYRWLRRYVDSGHDVNALALEAIAKRRRKPRVREDVRSCIAHHLMDEMAKPKGAHVYGAFDEVMEKVARELGYDGYRSKNGTLVILGTLDRHDATERPKKGLR